MNFIKDLFNQYGYIVLFIALMLELIALPTPGEALMTYCGFLVYQGELNWIISIIVAMCGVITGITISYLIGSIWGYSFFKKYGVYIHLGPDKLDKVSIWFKKYGNGLLTVAYFIPGVRHITGYFSGVTKIPYKKFATYSYLGAFIWTGVFISIGKILGSKWEQFHDSIKKYLIIGGIIVSIVLIGIYLYRSFKNKIWNSIKMMLVSFFRIFHSLGKVRIAVLSTSVIFIFFVIFVIGMIQDFLANEFILFDQIAYFIISQIFNDKWNRVFQISQYVYSNITFILITTFSVIWIIIKGKNRLLEISSFLFTILGGEVIEEILRYTFHRPGPLTSDLSNHAAFTFPSEQSLMVLTVYGFAAFVFVRHIKKQWISSLIIPFVLVICFLSGIIPVYYKYQYPSDVIAGYVFGGAWLSMNIVLLEILRILPQVHRK